MIRITLGDTWFLDEGFVKIRGELHYLWRAVDQDGDMIDILVQKRRNKKAAIRFYHLMLMAMMFALPLFAFAQEKQAPKQILFTNVNVWDAISVSMKKLVMGTLWMFLLLVVIKFQM